MQQDLKLTRETSVKDVLVSLSLERYLGVLFEEGYETIEDLLTAELEELKSIGLKIPHAKRVFSVVQNLQKQMAILEKEEKEGKEVVIEKSVAPKIIVEPVRIFKSPTPVFVNENVFPKELPKIELKSVQSSNMDPFNLLGSFIPPQTEKPKVDPLSVLSSFSNKVESKPSVDPMVLLSKGSFGEVKVNKVELIDVKTSDESFQGVKVIKTIENGPMPTLKPIFDQQETKRLNGLLLNCCQMGNVESAIEYIKQGATDVSKAFSCATSGGHERLYVMLYESYEGISLDNGLLAAAKSGNLKATSWCLEKGATRAEEALREAKAKKHKNLIFYLEKFLSGKVTGDLEYLSLRQMNSLLLNYAQIGNFDMVVKYVKMGANNLDKALCCACSGGQTRIVDFLMESGARDYDSAFLTACKSGNREMAKKMMKKGARPLAQGLEIAKKREAEELQYDIRLEMHQREPIFK